MAEDHTLRAEVLTPEGEVFDGEVKRVSTRTAVGEIGILANHVPVLARLQPTELRLETPDGETKRWAQAEGWLQVFANRAILLVSEAIEPEQLDRGELEQRIKDAEQGMSEADDGSAAQKQAERAKLRAEAFLGVASGD